MRAPQSLSRISAPLAAHLAGWVILALVFFLQSPGLVAADTKLDLVADPAKFLGAALNAYTDTFTLGQLQNQAYGYLFPQGFFFLLADPLPDWVAQRLWWTLSVGLGYSGMLALLRRATIGPTLGCQVLAAGLYALSPRTLTTLGAISSETWPAMVAPWILLPLWAAPTCRRGRLRACAASVVAVACLGAINATATLAACVPAGLYLLYRRQIRQLSAWLVGCALVSCWWILPLVVLGRYASPFTDYIESAGVTTKWLNLAEILRGTTSWTPFVEAERIAGHELVTNPYLVVVTMAVAGLGLVGLGAQAKAWPDARGYFITLLATGVLILGGAHLCTGFLDGAGQALRNVHKFDLLVRLPLAVGVANLGRLQVARRKTVAAACALLAVGAMAPSNRVLPEGAWQEIPSYWYEATDYINSTAANTRTLVLPASSFARQDWGWTRDELVQSLLDVPWAVRDSIPLVNPEAIRGLDGLTQHLTADNLERHGIGALIMRHDLAGTDVSTESLLSADAGFEADEYEVRNFGEVDVVLLDTARSMLVTDTTDVPTVAGGGEELALLGPGTYQLVDSNADIVTDTPALVARNYGSLGSTSAPLASLDEAADVLNPVKDYGSIGPLSTITGVGSIRASSSASDATAFGGSDPSRSVTAAVDGDDSTAWFPAPGSQQGQWIELDPAPDDAPEASESKRKLTVTTTGDVVELQISSGSAHVSLTVQPRKPATVTIPGEGTAPVRITLGASRYRAGIAEVSFNDATITRVLTVPDTSPDVQQFRFQRVLSGEAAISRQFTAPRDMQVEVTAAECFRTVLIDDTEYACGDIADLRAGTHTLSTKATQATLSMPGFDDAGARTSTLTFDSDGSIPIEPAEHDRVLVSARAANTGLRGVLTAADGSQLRLKPVTVNAGSQGFVLPAGTGGSFRLEFDGDGFYRVGLLGGGALGLTTVFGCLILVCVHRRSDMQHGKAPASPARQEDTHAPGMLPWVFSVGAATAAIGWPALPVALAVWAIARFTLLPRAVITAGTTGMAAMWLARAPWPSGNYAGDSLLLSVACAAALLSASAPALRTHRSLAL